MLYRFLDCEVDDVARTLTRDGGVVQVEPQVFELLLYLLRHRGRVASRHEIEGALWPGSHVLPSSLLTAIKRARTVIGDNGTAQRAIKTVLGTGYSFVASVAAISPEAGSGHHDHVAAVDDRATFVGREGLMARAGEIVEDMLAGHGSFVAIGGDAGMGKTTLARNIGVLAQSRGAEVLWASCGTALGTPPLWGWAEAIRAFATSRDDSTLRAAMGPGIVELAELVPSLAELAAKPESSSLALPEHRRARFIESLLGWLRSASGRRPLVIVFDDLHWADRSTLMVLGAAARAARELHLLLVGSFRPSEPVWRKQFAAPMAELREAGLCEQMSVPCLTCDEVVALLDGRFESAVDRQVAERIWQKTSGIPLFVLAIARQAVRQSGGDPANVVAALEQSEIPESVVAFITHILARLSPDTMRFVEACAVLGTRFDPGLGACLCGYDSSQVANSLREAEANGIVEAAAPGYAFVHELHREVVSQRTSAYVRAHLHYAAAGALRDRRSSLAELAFHLYEARSIAGGREVIEALMLAGEDALQNYAHDDAISFFERAQKWLDAEASDVPEQLRPSLLSKMAEACRCTGQLERGRALANEAVALAIASGPAELAATAAIHLANLYFPRAFRRNPQAAHHLQRVLEKRDKLPAPLRARAIARLACALHVDDDAADRRIALAREALALAADADPQVRYEIESDVFIALLDAEHTEERLALVEAQARSADFSGSPDFAALNALGRASTHLYLGNFAEVERAIADLEVAASHVKLREFIQPARHLASAVALHRGRIDEAAAALQVGDADGRHLPEEHFAVLVSSFVISFYQGTAGKQADLVPLLAEQLPDAPLDSLYPLFLARAGREGESRKTWERVRSDVIERLPPFTGPALGLPLAMYVAEACDEFGDEEIAAALYPRMAPHADLWGVVWFSTASVGLTARYLGLLASTMGDWKLAERHFDEAMAVYERVGAKADIPLVLCDRGRMLLRSGGRRSQQHGTRLIEEARRSAAALGMSLEERLRDG